MAKAGPRASDHWPVWAILGPPSLLTEVEGPDDQGVGLAGDGLAGDGLAGDGG